MPPITELSSCAAFLHFIQCLKIGCVKMPELQPIVFGGRTYFVFKGNKNCKLLSKLMNMHY